MRAPQYLESAGILSFGIFDKEFKNYIVPDQAGLEEHLERRGIL